MTQLVAQGGRSDIAGLKKAAESVQGSGAIEIRLDTKIEIPFSPDLRIGWMIKASLWSFERTVKLIPGVHLDRPITWNDNGEEGVLYIEARSNPLPILLAIVVALLPYLAALGIVLALSFIGWKIWDAAKEAGAGAVFLVIGVLAVVLFITKGKVPGVG